MKVKPDITTLTPARIRQSARAGRLAEPTVGLDAGYQQANIVILPDSAAEAFLGYVRAKPPGLPAACAVGEPGDPSLPALGTDIDIRTACRAIAFSATERRSRTWPK